MTNKTLVENDLRPELPPEVEELAGFLNDRDFANVYIRVQNSLAMQQKGQGALRTDEVAVRKEEELSSLRTELADRMMDNDLTEALKAWGKSPSRLRGNDSIDLGFNAGIVHYFEYRAVMEKARRFGPTEPFTIQGFIDYTARLGSVLGRPMPDGSMHSDNSNSDILFSAQIADAINFVEDVPVELARRKTMILTRDGLLIVAFQDVRDYSPKLITAIPETTEKGFVTALSEDLEGSPNSRERLNRLGKYRTLVYFAKAPLL